MDRQYLYTKNNEWEDYSGRAQIKRPDAQNNYLVSFDSNGKEYTYSQKRIAFVQEREVEVRKDYVYRIGEKTLSNPVRIVILESDNATFPNQTEVYYNDDKPHSHHSTQVVALPLAKANNIFRLLSSIAEAIKPEDKEERIREYLTKQYSRLGEQSLDGCSAEFMVSPDKPCRFERSGNVVIYPFGSNLSQMNAVDAALSNRLSLVEGPPGTGKTQTILNIIANLIMQDRNILVASPNNEATKNIFDKLEKEGFGFLVAALGRKENSDLFVASQEEKKQFPPTFKEWMLSEDERQSLLTVVAKSSSILRDIYSSKQQIAKDKETLRSLELEFSYFNERDQIESLIFRARTTLDRLRTLRNEIYQLIESKKTMTPLMRFKAVFLWGIGRWRDYDVLSVDTELSIDKAIFEMSISELKASIRACEKTLSAHNSETLIASVTTDSRTLLQDTLYQRYASTMDEPRHHFDNPWREPNYFRREYPIITSTTNAARNQMGNNGELFDYIIIDESSQADLVTGFLALSSARNAVVVGDVKQLPCVITEEEKGKAIPLFKNSGLPQHYDYTGVSLLDCLKGCIRHSGLSAPETLLKEHYRCHPDIIGFCNQQFYGGELIIMTEAQENNASEPLYLSLSAPGNHDRGQDFNRIQAKMFTQEALPFFSETYKRSEIGVATPYRVQVDEMNKMEEIPKDVQIDTIHKYQGREKDAMVFIAKVNDINDFIDSPNLINVAVSRAKKAFYLIAARQVVEGTNNVADLKRWIEYHGGEIIESKIYPAFPFLYSGMEDKRRAYIVKHSTRVDDEYSEVQMKEHVLEVLQALGLENQIGFCRNYPLKLMFSDECSSFNAEELRFIQTSAHADYIFFRCVDKSVVLELEVDGAQHKSDPEQIRRDAAKRAILEKTGIPQCVVQTNEERKTAMTILHNALTDALSNESQTNRIASNHKATSVAVSSDEAPWETIGDKDYA